MVNFPQDMVNVYLDMVIFSREMISLAGLSKYIMGYGKKSLIMTC
jgi:hypothetical protein